MDCRHVQDAILDSLIDRAALTPGIHEHIAACPACAAFAARQMAVDAGLRQALAAPVVSARLRAAVRERIRHESRPVWRDVLPDVVHFASCGVATVVSLLALPFDPAVVLAVALVTTLASHAVLTAMHGSLDAAGESGI
jgi:anti-sigma factor RsiW